ncbi:hypothetical protein [Bacillus manliponensis]|uniref:hypothetical protein n=1 Tax=Bacillus manliponensis TaxID=574376 RepID=UPI003513E1A5
MRGIREEKLGIFKIAVRNRLSPEMIKWFLISVFIYCSIPMYVMFYSIFSYGIDLFYTQFEEILAYTAIVLYGIQLLLLIPFLIPKLNFKLQKLQAIVFLFATFQLCTSWFFMLLIESVYSFYSNSQTIVYVGLLLVGALVKHILATIEIFKDMENGGFQYERSFNTISISTSFRFVIGGLAYIILLLILIFININFDIGAMVFYVIQTAILYIFAFLSAEFVLLTYCKFKFPSLNVSWEQHVKERAEYVGRAKRLKEQEKREKKD